MTCTGCAKAAALGLARCLLHARELGWPAPLGCATRSSWRRPGSRPGLNASVLAAEVLSKVHLVRPSRDLVLLNES